MPADARGSVFRTRNGYGIRWPEADRRPQMSGFQTKNAARACLAKIQTAEFQPLKEKLTRRIETE